MIAQIHDHLAGGRSFIQFFFHFSHHGCGDTSVSSHHSGYILGESFWALLASALTLSLSISMSAWGVTLYDISHTTFFNDRSACGSFFFFSFYRTYVFSQLKVGEVSRCAQIVTIRAFLIKANHKVVYMNRSSVHKATDICRGWYMGTKPSS